MHAGPTSGKRNSRVESIEHVSGSNPPTPKPLSFAASIVGTTLQTPPKDLSGCSKDAYALQGV